MAYVLYEDDFIHVVNIENGELELIQGPCRFVLPHNKQQYGSNQKKIVLRDGQYCIISNPYNKAKGQIQYGEREVRKGPATFSIYPGETAGSVQNAEVLNKSQAIVVKALKDFRDEKGVERKAGELYQIVGPAVWIPKVYEQKVRFENAITVSENEAIYVRNTATSELKLIKGPTSYILGVNEEKYLKRLSDDEYTALGISNREPSFKAYVIQVQKNEILCVVDVKNNKEKFVVGPESHILGPQESIKVLDISAGVPKIENQAKLAQVQLGPDFMQDSFTVRSKDNAVLNMTLSYKWRFLVDETSYWRCFESDFIGYSCQSLRSRIREEASQHDFEKFHTSSSQILRGKLFKDYDVELLRNGNKVTEKHRGRLFREFNLMIFELDVKQITPADQEIDRLLNESIKSSMEILCRKLNDNAATASEKEKIESEQEIAKLKRNLIEIENANYTKEVLEKAKIEGMEQIESAKAHNEAEYLLEKARLDIEVKHMQDTIELLRGPGGDKYIEYVKALSLHENVSCLTVLPKETKSLFVPNE